MPQAAKLGLANAAAEFAKDYPGVSAALRFSTLSGKPGPLAGNVTWLGQEIQKLLTNL